VVFTRGAATVRLILKTNSAFRGTLGLYPVRRGIGGRAIKRALVAKRIAGRGGRNVVLPARFSTRSTTFPLELRSPCLTDPRGGGPHRRAQHPGAPLPRARPSSVDRWTRGRARRSRP
jgi:hypothetical protein